MTYTIHDALEVAKLAAADISAWLRLQSETISIVNVEDDPDYQRRDINLISVGVSYYTTVGRLVPGVKIEHL